MQRLTILETQASLELKESSRVKVEDEKESCVTARLTEVEEVLL
jgi:hypothetical protein